MLTFFYQDVDVEYQLLEIGETIFPSIDLATVNMSTAVGTTELEQAINRLFIHFLTHSLI